MCCRHPRRPLACSLVGGDSAAERVRRSRVCSLCCPSVCVLACLAAAALLAGGGGVSCLQYALSRLDALGLPATLALFALLYTAVSLPPIWGYSVLNVAGGYLYGLAFGALLSAGCAAVGVTVAHFVLTGCLSGCVNKLLAGALDLRMLAGVAPNRKLVLQLVFLARLTPVPFGLQNALFSVSGMPLRHYLAATSLGLLPMQVLYAYLGSTLRSMEEVFASDKASMAWLALGGQILLSIGLLIFVARKARTYLLESMTGLEHSNSAKRACLGASMPCCRDSDIGLQPEECIV